MKLKVVLIFLGVVFISLIFWAMGMKPLSESADLLLKDPWGIVTLADLYLGFFIFILFIFKSASNKAYALLWSISLLVLGNIISVIYLICFLSGLGVKKGFLREL